MSEHECAPKVREMIRIANVSGKLVSGFESILEFLDSKQLAWGPVQINCSHLIPDSENRSGTGVSPHDSHALGLKFIKNGFSFKKQNQAVCVEMSAGAGGQEALRRATQMSRLSRGKVPEPSTSVRYCTLSSGHSNMFLNSVAQRCPTAIVELQAPGSQNIDADRILGDDPQLRAAVEKGLHWIVVSREIADVDGFKALAQRALNTDAREHQSETELI